MDSEKGKKIIFGVLILVVVVVLIIVLPVVSGNKPTNEQNTTAIETKEGREKRVDLSRYDRNVNLEGEQIIRQQQQIEEDLVFSDKLTAPDYFTIINSEDIPELAEPIVYIVDKKGNTVRQVGGDNRQSAQTNVRQQSVTRENTSTRPLIQQEQQITQAQQAQDNTLAALTAALLAEKDVIREDNREIAGNINKISAVIHGDQRLVSNGRVRLRTIEAGTLGNINLPANTFIYGIISVNENRVQININTAFINGKDTRVTAVVYDASDGGQGIYVEGLNISGEISGGVANEVANTAAGAGTTGRIAGGIVRSVSGKREREIILSNNHKVFIL